MAITDAQQAKQIMMKKGGPVHRHQLAKKRKDGKRPGYYGPDAGHAGEMGSKGFGADTYSGGPSNIDVGGGPGGSKRNAKTRLQHQARMRKPSTASPITSSKKRASRASLKAHTHTVHGGSWTTISLALQMSRPTTMSAKRDRLNIRFHLATNPLSWGKDALNNQCIASPAHNSDTPKQLTMTNPKPSLMTPTDTTNLAQPSLTRPTERV